MSGDSFYRFYKQLKEFVRVLEREGDPTLTYEDNVKRRDNFAATVDRRKSFALLRTFGKYFEVDHLVEKRFLQYLDSAGRDKSQYESKIVPKDLTVARLMNRLRGQLKFPYYHQQKTAMMNRLIPHRMEGLYTKQQIWDAHAWTFHQLKLPNLKVELEALKEYFRGYRVKFRIPKKDPSKNKSWRRKLNYKYDPKRTDEINDSKKPHGKVVKKLGGPATTFFDNEPRKAAGKPRKSPATSPSVFSGISTKDARSATKPSFRFQNPFDPEPTYSRKASVVPKSDPLPVAHQENRDTIRGVPTRNRNKTKRGSRLRRTGRSAIHGGGRLARSGAGGAFAIADFLWRSYWEAEAKKIKDKSRIFAAQIGEKETRRIEKTIQKKQPFIHKLLKEKRHDIVGLINQGRPVYVIVRLELEFDDLDYGAMFFKRGDSPNRWEFSHISHYDVSVSDTMVPDNMRILNRKRGMFIKGRPVAKEGILERKVTAGVKDQTLQEFTYSVKLHRGMSLQERRLSERLGTPVYVDTPQTSAGEWKPSANE